MHVEKYSLIFWGKYIIKLIIIIAINIREAVKWGNVLLSLQTWEFSRNFYLHIALKKTVFLGGGGGEGATYAVRSAFIRHLIKLFWNWQFFSKKMYRIKNSCKQWNIYFITTWTLQKLKLQVSFACKIKNKKNYFYFKYFNCKIIITFKTKFS